MAAYRLRTSVVNPLDKSTLLRIPKDAFQIAMAQCFGCGRRTKYTSK